MCLLCYLCSKTSRTKKAMLDSLFAFEYCNMILKYLNMWRHSCLVSVQMLLNHFRVMTVNIWQVGSWTLYFSERKDKLNEHVTRRMTSHCSPQTCRHAVSVAVCIEVYVPLKNKASVAPACAHSCAKPLVFTCMH